MKLRFKNQSSKINHRHSKIVPVDSPKKFSYRSNRSADDLNVTRLPRDLQTKNSSVNKNKWLARSSLYGAILIVAGTFIYALTLSTTPKITIVHQTNQSIVQSSSIYLQAAQKLLSSSILNRTKLTINTDKLANELENQFPELSGVSIIIPLLGHKPIVEIRPSNSILILANAQGKYIINQEGVAILKISNSLANKFTLPVTTDDSGLDVKLGQQVLSSSTVLFILTVINEFTAKNMPLQSLTLSTVPYELDVKVRGEPYYIKFNLLSNPLYSIGTYFATLKIFTPTNPGPTQYIDVRIPGRAYYK